MEVSTTADEIEFEIKRLPRDGFRAMVYIFRGGQWWPPDTKLCVSGPFVASRSLIA